MKEHQTTPPFLQGGGEMGKLIRSIDWSATPLNDVHAWPSCLQTAVAMMLSSPFPIYIAWGKEYTQLYNDAYRPILGQAKHPRAMGISTRETFREIWSAVGPMFDDVMAGKPVFHREFLYVLERNDYPEECYFDFSYSPIRYENGLIGGVLVICMETTEMVLSRRKLEENYEQLRLAGQAESKARQEIDESEKRFHVMAESSDILIAVGDETSNATYFSKAWVELTGRPMADLIEFGWADLLHPDDKDPYLAIYRSAFEAKNSFNGEFRILSSDGQYRWLLARGVPRINGDGSLAGYISSCIDITSRKESEELLAALNKELAASNEELTATNEELARTQENLEEIVKELAASEERFRFLIQGAPVAICVLNGQELIIESANDKIRALWGKTSAVIGQSLATAIPELEGQPFFDILNDVFCSGNAYYGYETNANFKHGEELQELYFDFIYQPLLENEQTSSIIVVAIDVTEKVKAKKDLEKAYEQVHLSKQAALLGTFDMDLEKGTLEWDDRCRTLFGISHRDPVTYEKDFVSGLHPDDRERVIRVIDEVMIRSVSNGDYDVEYRTVGAEDQQLRWVRAKGKAYFDEQDRPVRFIGSVLDITDQKSYDDKIQRYTRNVEILNTVGKLVGESLDIEAILQRVTDATTQITGAAFGAFFYNHLDARGESYTLFTLSGAPREAFEKFGTPRNTAVFHPTFSGDEIVRVDDITKDPRYGHNPPHHGMPKGHLPVVSYLAVPVVSKSGAVIGGLFYGHPEPGKFTEEHEKLVVGVANQASVALDNAKLYDEIQKLNSKKDEFIGLASHELKTPVTSLTGYLQIISKRLPDTDMNKSFVDKALVQIRKLSNLISDLLDVSKIESGELPLAYSTFDMVTFVRETIEQFQYGVRSHYIALDTNENSLMISADRQRIEQVMINLLSNAVKYSPKADLVNVTVVGGPQSITVRVQDFGMGIKKEQQERIFSRFYRVEDMASHISGLGIGLFISRQIVSRHHGSLSVESEAGKGSVFSFELPISK